MSTPTLQTLHPLRSRSSEPFAARIPGSKSYTNRALILAAQRMGTTRVTNGLFCDDTDRLSEALAEFEGLEVNKTEDGFVTQRTRETLGGARNELFMGGAGTPARFMLSFAATAEGSSVVTGIPRLCERPMVDLLSTLTELGIRHEPLGEANHLPTRVHGGPIQSKVWTIHGGVSSQFTSSLCLLAAQQAQGPIRIRVEGDQVSKPYVGMTLAMMNSVGIRTEREGSDTLVVYPARPNRAVIPVEVDASGMSYFLAAAAITGTTVEIPGITGDSAQGDVRLARTFAEMGCTVTFESDRLRIAGGELKGIDIDMDKMPDVVLTLAMVAARAQGPTRITNIANLRVKECDRIHATVAELAKLGVRCEEGPDWLVVHPNPAGALTPGRIQTYDDHRVAMAFAVLSLVSEGVEIEDPDCVAKSFPRFWDELERFQAHHQA